jgi:hypothetical protein
MKLKNHIHKTVTATLCVLSLSPALVFAGGITGAMGNFSVGQNTEESDADYVANSTQPSEEQGVIKSVDLSARTLVVTRHKANTEQTFQWNDQTKFMERNKSADASALKQGERVHLTFSPGSDTPVLQRVHIAPARQTKQSANTLPPATSKGV